MTLNAENTLTIWDTQTEVFDGEDGEWATVRILDTLYRIENDGGNFIWNSLSVSGTYTPRIEFVLGEDEGVSYDLGTPKLPYSITWVGYTPGSPPEHTFTIELPDTYDCVRGNTRIPSDLAEELVEPVNIENATPTPRPWVDFNEWHRTYRIYKQFAILNSYNLLCPEDLPDEPKIEDYG